MGDIWAWVDKARGQITEKYLTNTDMDAGNMKIGDRMNDEKLHEWVIVGLLIASGSIAGVLMQIANHEYNRPWAEVLASAILNGMFTAGIYFLLLFLYPSLSVIAAVVIASSLSTIGRSTLLRVLEKWLKK
jgi:hypothetical protein